MFLDGGMRLLQLDPRTGGMVSEIIMDEKDPRTGKNLHSLVESLDMPVGLPDILSSDGKHIYMRSQQFDLDGNRTFIGVRDIRDQSGEGAHVFSPIGFDKFSDGKMKTLLDLYDIDTLIITGCKVNMAILYTATKAAAEYKYNIIIPVDGIIGTTDYEKEYALYQFRTYPKGSTTSFTFTEMDMINFSSDK